MIRTALAALLAAVAFAGCTANQEPPATPRAQTAEPGKPRPDRPRTGTFPLTGVVREIDREGGFVTVRHDEIPGFMPAMTMPLRAAKPEELAEVQVGDTIAATLRVESESSRLEDIVVTKPATLQVTVAGGQVEMRPVVPVLDPGDLVPDFTMTTQDGRSLGLKDLRGQYVVLTFVYTRCPIPEFCPAMDKKFQALAQSIRAVPGRSGRVRLLSVSFDPEHDTPEVLARHAAQVGAEPPLWTYAVAKHEELKKIAQSVGLVYGPTKDELAHNLRVALIGPDGRLIRLESGQAWQPEALLRVLLPRLSPTRGNP